MELGLNPVKFWYFLLLQTPYVEKAVKIQETHEEGLPVYLNKYRMIRELISHSEGIPDFLNEYRMIRELMSLSEGIPDLPE